jgi:probable phosphoglycerate mutase
MSNPTAIYLARHGETAWSLTGQHTGLTDLPLTERGRQNAIRLGERLRGTKIDHVSTSPLTRARDTCSLAGFGESAKIDSDLLEWNYGAYEGMRSEEIRKQAPDWQLFRDGCPGGDSPAQIGARADRVLARLAGLSGTVLLFSSGHFLRVLGARWLGMDVSGGRLFFLSTASLSCLGWEHQRDRVLRLWNDDHHTGP